MYFGKHMSVWVDTDDSVDYAELKGEKEVDVAIIGGGIAGMSIGTLLKQEGLKVAIIESNKIGHYITGTSTAKVSYASPLMYSHILSTFGKEFALKFKDACSKGFNKVGELVTTLNIDADYKTVPFYILSDGQNSLKLFEKELEALNELNIDGDIVNNVPFPFERNKNALVYENQGEIHPFKYLHGLADYVNGEDSFIFENSKVIAIEKDGVDLITSEKIEDLDYIYKYTDSSGNNEDFNIDANDFKTVITKNGRVKTRNIVIATNSPIFDPDSVYKHLIQNKSHALGFYIRNKFPKSMFVRLDPFCTLRSIKTEKGTLVILLGEHHKIWDTGSKWDFYKKMRDLAEELFDVESFEYFWTGGDNLTEDRLPIIGETSEKSIYVVTGFNSWGMVNGTISGMVIRDLILKCENNFKDIFDPLRFKDLSTKLNDDKTNKFSSTQLVHWDSLGNNIVNLELDSAKLIEFEDKRMAIYKDEFANVFVLEGQCTHKTCSLCWNDAERTWECPCHGSIFSYKGEVIHGPAVKNLERLL
ncbi:FAD-dependent oxidoreductase [Methanobrevibacter filiformis]|uniref:Gamma-glutamylputrescine oxidoreductase n=1 Tax=Methanobrevibacter filiformis TaxID=55758 RepID=A0A165Z834_9EURY|nr:FAD-dependent oxidoreductase [Methanobrevibacter filiformis]KZX10372.1 gamma-glutamylputrescine oxidoreductase [Methanobrevibacter filiformis]